MNADSETALLTRAAALTNRQLGALARELGASVPQDLRRAKGWVGELMELVLGATAGSRPIPDFPALGVELKTVPVNRDGGARESTYVCTAPLIGNIAQTWETSVVRAKLNRVLWIPVEADPAIDLAARCIGRPRLWSPTPADEAVLRADWQELMDLICMGELEHLSSELGTWLQIRPKAIDGRARAPASTADGSPDRSVARGFYLRTAFTNRILRGDA